MRATSKPMRIPTVRLRGRVAGLGHLVRFSHSIRLDHGHVVAGLFSREKTGGGKDDDER